MNTGEVKTSKTTPATGELKRKLLILSAIFGVIYVIIVVLPVLTITPVDWFLERIQGVTFVEGWTPGTMVYSVLIVLLPFAYIVIAFIIFMKVRRNR